MRQIEILVDDVTAVVTLREAKAPQATAMVWDTLPTESSLAHSRWGGNCATIAAPQLTRPDLPVEDQVSFLYPMMLAYRPAAGELTISYGQAQARDQWGTHWVTYLGDVIENAPALMKKLQETRDIGVKTVVLRQREGQA